MLVGIVFETLNKGRKIRWVHSLDIQKVILKPESVLEDERVRVEVLVKPNPVAKDSPRDRERVFLIDLSQDN